MTEVSSFQELVDLLKENSSSEGLSERDALETLAKITQKFRVYKEKNYTLEQNAIEGELRHSAEALRRRYTPSDYIHMHSSIIKDLGFIDNLFALLSKRNDMEFNSKLINFLGSIKLGMSAGDYPELNGISTQMSLIYGTDRRSYEWFSEMQLRLYCIFESLKKGALDKDIVAEAMSDAAEWCNDRKQEVVRYLSEETEDWHKLVPNCLNLNSGLAKHRFRDINAVASLIKGEQFSKKIRDIVYATAKGEIRLKPVLRNGDLKLRNRSQLNLSGLRKDQVSVIQATKAFYGYLLGLKYETQYPRYAINILPPKTFVDKVRLYTGMTNSDEMMLRSLVKSGYYSPQALVDGVNRYLRESILEQDLGILRHYFYANDAHDALIIGELQRLKFLEKRI